MARLSKLYFSDKELACKSTNVVKLDPVFDKELLLLRVKFGMRMKTNSCCRSAARNEAVGGHPKSLHVYDFPKHKTAGTAAIDIARIDKDYDEALAKTAWQMGWSIGVSNNFLHLDCRKKILDMPQLVYAYANLPDGELAHFQQLVKEKI